MKKFLIFFLMLLPLAIASCGGDEKDEPQIGGENGGNTSSESTEYIATESVKTITLKPNGQEYMLFKDYYWKHKIWLDGTNISINSYYGGGNGWQLHNGNEWWLGCGNSAIRDWGELSSIAGIFQHTIQYSSWVTSTLHFNIIGNSSYVQYFSPSVAFKPNHGYELAFRIGADYNINYIRFYPINYTLDSNDRVSSITIQYQLF